MAHDGAVIGPGRPTIHVVTPYCRETLEQLRRCHDSVMAQTVDAQIVHVMVADGEPRNMLDEWPVEHVTLPRAHADFGNTPRGIGGIVAAAQGTDFLAYLDADNWFQPTHLEQMLDAHRRTGAWIVCSWREFFTPAGGRLAIEEIDENALNHVDTSCFLIQRQAQGINDVWVQIPRRLSAVGDRIFFRAIKHRRFLIHHTCSRTVAYTSIYAQHYTATGAIPPVGAKDGDYTAELHYLQSDEGMREISDRLGFCFW